MPVYLDIHSVGGATAEDVAKAHQADLDVQVKYGVEYTKYWLNERRGKIFCLCSAPSADAAAAVHREAHGLVAEKVIEVDPDLLESLLGDAVANERGAVLMPGSASERDPGVRTILFTDIVGSTAFTQKYGDQATVEILGVHDQIVRFSLNRAEGREVKHTGDGIMASFVSAPAAVRCATEIHEALARYSEHGKHPLQVRIGAAAGEPVERNNDVFGSTVQLAARLCAHAEPGQTLVSASVAELCEGIALKPLGQVLLKGFEQPVAAHLVG